MLRYVEVVILAEVIKLIISGFLCVTDKSSDTDAPSHALQKISWLLLNSQKVS